MTRIWEEDVQELQSKVLYGVQKCVIITVVEIEGAASLVLAIYGAGGLGREVLETSDLIQENEKRWESIYFVDDGERDQEHRLLHGVPIVDFDTITARFRPDECQFVIAVGEPAVRESLFNKVKEKGYTLATIVHPGVSVPKSAVIGEGTTVQMMVCIGPDVVIGDNVLLQPMVTIGHDSRIGRSSVCSSSTNISGHCTVGDRTYLAVHVGVRENITIGNDTVIGMGSIVLRDIPDNVIALGDPARPMKNKNDSRVFSGSAGAKS